MKTLAILLGLMTIANQAQARCATQELVSLSALSVGMEEEKYPGHDQCSLTFTPLYSKNSSTYINYGVQSRCPDRSARAYFVRIGVNADGTCNQASAYVTGAVSKPAPAPKVTTQSEKYKRYLEREKEKRMMRAMENVGRY